MASPFPFGFMLVFGWLACMLIGGVFLRAQIAFFQKFLFPSCLIGEFLGLILVQLGAIEITPGALETAAYHFFNISFISVGLTPGGTSANLPPARREFVRGPAWMALVQTAAFGLQAATGAAGGAFSSENRSFGPGQRRDNGLLTIALGCCINGVLE
ncbi:MAG: hypothetical protein JSW39_06900 [Desulfobacterales bacterium]|nr:MAG: hypothetical protein JSW39_06900 [Desulfobacterales bacterium]